MNYNNTIIYVLTGVDRDGVVRYATNVWFIRDADMDLAMEVRGNVSVIRIGEEYYVIKVNFTLFLNFETES